MSVFDTLMLPWGGSVNNFLLWAIGIVGLAISVGIYRFSTLKAIGYKTGKLDKLRTYQSSLERSIKSLGDEVEILRNRRQKDLGHLLGTATTTDDLLEWIANNEVVLGASFESIALNSLALLPDSYQGTRYSLLAKAFKCSEAYDIVSKDELASYFVGGLSQPAMLGSEGDGIWEDLVSSILKYSPDALGKLAPIENKKGHAEYKQGNYHSSFLHYRLNFYCITKLHGADHPDTATSLNNLAGLYKSQGHLEKAEPLYKRALEIREDKLGPDHPYTATSLNNLAGLYKAQGHLEKAEPLYKRALEIREDKLGPDHPDTVALRNYLLSLPNVLPD